MTQMLSLRTNKYANLRRTGCTVTGGVRAQLLLHRRQVVGLRDLYARTLEGDNDHVGHLSRFVVMLVAFDQPTLYATPHGGIEEELPADGLKRERDFRRKM